ncbi:MAG: hypothetical protein EP320_08515 [Rhodobacteraceae bacterium]|nr:MAG: hypothetical protein EP320_08515 [Paracoccaceae bacterium]
MIKKLIAAALLCPTASGALAFEFESAEAGMSYSKLEFTDYPDGYKFKEGYITAAGWFSPKLGVQIGYNHGFIKGDYDSYDFDSVQIHGLWQQSETLRLGVMGAHEKYDGWHYNQFGLEALYTPGRWKIECRTMPAVAKPSAMTKAGAMTDSTCGMPGCGSALAGATRESSSTTAPLSGFSGSRGRPGPRRAFCLRAPRTRH